MNYEYIAHLLEDIFEAEKNLMKSAGINRLARSEVSEPRSTTGLRLFGEHHPYCPAPHQQRKESPT